MLTATVGVFGSALLMIIVVLLYWPSPSPVAGPLRWGPGRAAGQGGRVKKPGWVPGWPQAIGNTAKNGVPARPKNTGRPGGRNLLGAPPKTGPGCVPGQLFSWHFVASFVTWFVLDFAGVTLFDHLDALSNVLQLVLTIFT